MATLFFSYSHKDEALRDELEVHLAMLKREGAISAWHDRRIVAGDEFDHAIDENLEHADVILLLVSPDFLASTYCFDVEVKRAMQRHADGSARVIPVIFRPCDWHKAPFAKLLAAPKDGKPVTKWADRDDAFLDVVQLLRAALPAPAAQKTVMPAAPVVARAAAPRSSNLRLRKNFSDADRDQFMIDTFEYTARFFENSLSELKDRNDAITTRFTRIDPHHFSAVVYRAGNKAASCRIWLGAHGSPIRGIVYAANDSGGDNSFNESLSIENDDQHLYLRPLGMPMRGESGRESRLSAEGASEYYWSLLIEPLQRR